MSERCKECGTPVDEVPLGDCATHRAASFAEDVKRRLASRMGRIEQLEDKIGKLDYGPVRDILFDIAELLK